MAFWILSCPTDLDYHYMDKMKIEDLKAENEECFVLCKELIVFIGDLPSMYDPQQWDSFMSMIKHRSPNQFSSPLVCD